MKHKQGWTILSKEFQAKGYNMELIYKFVIYSAVPLTSLNQHKILLFQRKAIYVVQQFFWVWNIFCNKAKGLREMFDEKIRGEKSHETVPFKGRVQQEGRTIDSNDPFWQNR